MATWPIPSTDAREPARRAPSTSPDMIRLDALGGPSETMQAAGLTNRGSLAYAMTHRGFPQPVKTLRGIRLWDLDAVKQWTTKQQER